MNILFTVCGRAGSRGLQGKNLSQFLGQPLVFYTLAAIKLYKEQFGDEDNIWTCLNTDSDELIKLVLSYTPDIFVIRRTPELSGDTVAKMAVIKDCLSKTSQKDNIDYDIVVDLDITSPLRTVRDIKNAIEKKKSLPMVDIVFSVTHSRRSPYFNMVKKNDDGIWSRVIESSYSARQQAPEFFDMNASLYAWDARFLCSNQSNNLFDGVCDVIEMMDTGILDIDSEEDLKMMELIAAWIYSKLPEYAAIRDAAKR